ncbi:MAG: hypothetical protein AVDCRST_MAG91-2630, partial [uncultured Sphingomonadaceae bacterium]
GHELQFLRRSLRGSQRTAQLPSGTADLAVDRRGNPGGPRRRAFPAPAYSQRPI